MTSKILKSVKKRIVACLRDAMEQILFGASLLTENKQTMP